MNKLYCPVCKKEVNYRIEKKLVKYSDDDTCFEYYIQVAICNDCGEELYDDNLMEANQKAFEDAYKNNNDIISKEDIQKILDKYNITKRNLPIILELGELTITRYIDGDYIPNKKISNLLRQIYNSPEKYKEYLEKNGNKLNKLAYNKTSNMVNNLLGINDDLVLEEVSKYIILNNAETTDLVLQKMLYYVTVFYELFYGKSPFKSKCAAWEHGPVYGKAYYKYKEFGKDAIEINNTNINLDNDLKEIVDEIIKDFGCFSGKVLTSFTHNEDSWQITKAKGENYIDNGDILSFARKIKRHYQINEVKDISKYSLDKYNEYLKKYN